MSIVRRSFRMSAMGGTVQRSYTSLPNLKKEVTGVALPQLPFPLSEGCKPAFTPQQLALHYSKHHKAYVDKLNALTEGLFVGKTVEEILLENKDKPSSTKPHSTLIIPSSGAVLSRTGSR